MVDPNMIHCNLLSTMNEFTSIEMSLGKRYVEYVWLYLKSKNAVRHLVPFKRSF